MNNDIINLKEMGFELLRVDNNARKRAGKPARSIVVLSKSGLYFSKGALKLMEYPEFVRVYVNEQAHKVGLQEITAIEAKNDLDARVLVSKENKMKIEAGKQVTIRWASKDFLMEMFKVAGISEQQKIEAPLEEDSVTGLFIIDFNMG